MQILFDEINGLTLTLLIFIALSMIFCITIYNLFIRKLVVDKEFLLAAFCFNYTIFFTIVFIIIVSLTFIILVILGLGALILIGISLLFLIIAASLFSKNLY